MSQSKEERLNTNIWYEVQEPNNPFAAAKCICSGYDVFGDLLHKANWFEYLFLLFRLEKPQPWQAELLEKVAIAIANPGIRDASVRAAMNAGAGGSTSASALMAALAVGAGNLGGSREIYDCIVNWNNREHKISNWKVKDSVDDNEIDSWPKQEHPPGFDPNGVDCATPVKQLLALCCNYEQALTARWLSDNRVELEEYYEMPISITFVVATVFYDLGFSPEESEMLFLMLRLPGAAAHALEQKQQGYKQYPFFLDKLSINKS